LDVLEDRNLLSTYTVNSLIDTGTGSGVTGDLRYCITRATSGNDTITFAPSLTGTINLESALPALNASVAIQGPGAAALTVERDPASSASFGIFAVGSTATAEISGLEIFGGNEGAVTNAGTLTVRACGFGANSNNSNGASTITNSGTATVSNCSLDGSGPSTSGAIDNTGTMTVSNSYLSNTESSGIANSGVLTLNFCTLSKCGSGGGILFVVAQGGAIFNQGALTINNCTLNSNEAFGGFSFGSNGMGGAIYMSAGTLSINSSTLAYNNAVGSLHATSSGAQSYTANGYGGGLYIAGGTVSINNSTIAGNGAAGVVGDGGGICNAAGPGALQMYDTILADNSADIGGPDLDGSVTSLGHNLIGGSTGGSGFAASDLLNVNPQLGPLQNNGGPTQTMALLPGSPAINAGDNTNAPAYDQRGPGFPRIVGGTIDIGAFEVQATTNQLSSFSISGFPASITAGVAGTFTVTALNADGSTDTSYTDTVHFTSSDIQAGLPADYTFTSADAGVHSFSAILKTAGTQSITATDTATGITASQTGIVVNPAAASSFLVRGYPSPSTAGVVGGFSVTAIDPFGNTATGYSGTVHFTSSDARAVPPANYTFQASDYGVRSFLATLKTAGTQSITVKDTSAGFSGSDTGITVKPAAASTFAITAPRSVVAGARFSLTVTVLDAYGNLVTGYTGTVHFSSTDGTATLPANYTFQASDGGKHTFTVLVLRKKGEQTITVTDKANSSVHGSALVDVLSKPRSRLNVFYHSALEIWP